MTTTTTTQAPTITEHNKPMPATERCTRCGAQAYVEVLLTESNGTLLFCAHHFNVHEDVLTARTDVMIADHRPYLRKLEGGQRDAGSV